MTGNALVLAIVAATQVACVGIGGETIRLEHDLVRTDAPFESPRFVSVVEPAVDKRSDRSRIGYATMGMFSMEIGDIRTHASVGEEVARVVADALESAGYQVVVGDREELLGEGGESIRSPAVVVKVEKLSFENYNWFWPYVPTRGKIQLAIEVWTPENERIFFQRVRGSGESYRLTGNSAFSRATRDAMTEVLRKLLDAISTPEFQAAAVRSAAEEAARNRQTIMEDP